MDVMVKEQAYPRKVGELPEWLRDLPGYAVLGPMLRDAAPKRSKGPWGVNIRMPSASEMKRGAADVDPLVWLVTLAYAAARIDDKLGEVVRTCRANGSSWTQIGQALGMSKQAAWERFSGED
jgi:hypothetical protein